MIKGTAPNTLSLTDAAYIAGLIDGEGTVTLTRRHLNEHRQLCVSISSTERSMLEFVQLALGAGKITNKRTSSRRHSPSFTFAICNRQALSVLTQVLPWLKSYKRSRAELIVRDYLRVTPRNGKYTAELLEQKAHFERQVMSLRANGKV